MSIPVKYDKKMKDSWGMHATWFPGTKFAVGDIVQKAQDGTYQRIGKLQKLGIAVTSTPSEALKTGFKSAATKVRIFQLGGEVSQTQVDAEASAEVEFEFTKSESFSVATPVGTADTMDNLLGVAGQIAAVPNFDHRRWRIVRQVVTAKGFTMLGSESKKSKVKFSGKGKAVLDFVNFGLSAGITRSGTSSVDVEFIGTNGGLGIDLARIKSNGAVVVG